MAEECRYYYYDCGYCCALKREKEGNSSIDSDTVHRYCWGYQYEYCPRYKSASSSSGGCYLTSACVEARGMADDCYQLQTLRAFRDGYLRGVDGGEKEIAEYYLIAPAVVENIKKRDDSTSIFEKVYTELVAPCVELIEQGNNEEAHKLYKDYTIKLKLKFI